MDRRVRKTALVVLVVTLSLNATSLYAAPRDRDRGPRFIDRVGRIVRQIVKPLIPVTLEDNVPMPGPPKP